MADNLIIHGIPKGYYTEESQIHVSDKQLQEALDIKPEKIIVGQSIAGVSGAAVVDGIDTSDATAIPEDLISGKTAYVASGLITGTMVNQPGEVPSDGWDFITETISPGQSTTYGRAMFIGIPKGAYMTPISNKSWTGPELPTIRVPVKSVTLTPSEFQQSAFTTTSVLEKVTVKPIPSKYKDTTGTDATAADILAGKKAVTADGVVTGTIQGVNSCTSSIVRWTSTIEDTEQPEEEVATEEESSIIGESQNTVSGDEGETIEVNPSMGVELDGENTDGEIYEEDEGYPWYGDLEIDIPSAYYYTGATITVPGEVVHEVLNISADSIMAGYTIAGIEGTATSDANAVGAHILTGDTAYVKGSKITGTAPINPAWHSNNTSCWWDATTPTTLSVSFPFGYYEKISVSSSNSSIMILNAGEHITATPSKSTQVVDPGTTKLIRSVTINPIPSEYITTTDATATAAHILEGDTAYVKGSKVTGTMPNRYASIDPELGGSSSNYPSLPVWKSRITNFSTTTKGVRVCKFSPPTGYYNGDGATYIGEKATSYTVTPSASTQTFTSNNTNGIIETVTVNPIPSNYIDTSNTTATAGNILSGKTAWVNGSKITGTIASMSGGTYTSTSTTQTINCSGKYMTSNITVGAIPSTYHQYYENPTPTASYFVDDQYSQSFSVDFGANAANKKMFMLIGYVYSDYNSTNFYFDGGNKGDVMSLMFGNGSDSGYNEFEIEILSEESGGRKKNFQVLNENYSNGVGNTFYIAFTGFFV